MAARPQLRACHHSWARIEPAASKSYRAQILIRARSSSTIQYSSVAVVAGGSCVRTRSPAPSRTRDHVLCLSSYREAARNPRARRSVRPRAAGTRRERPAPAQRLLCRACRRVPARAVQRKETGGGRCCARQPGARLCAPQRNPPTSARDRGWRAPRPRRGRPLAGFLTMVPPAVSWRQS